LLQLQQLEEATNLLNTIGPDQREVYDQAQALQGMMALQAIAAESPGDHPLDEPFIRAAQAAIAQDYAAAFAGFLEVVSRDRQYRHDAARKAMITLFDSLGSDHELTLAYRKKLTRALY
jgi:putative thioredoxin